MIEVVQKTIEFYLKNLRAPELSELQLSDSSSNQQKGCIFVTLYLKGEVHGSAGNIKETTGYNLTQELIASTIDAIKDTRFAPITREESTEIKIRVDYIEKRTPLSKLSDLKDIDPTAQWVIAILKNYENLAVVLPNISPKLITGEDFIAVLENKLATTKLSEKNTIFYKIETKMQTNY